MRDPYQILGVRPTASAAEIKAAYRALAKKLHPDFAGSDQKAKARFQEVTAAYELVGNPEQRRRYDQGEIDGEGAPRPRARTRSSSFRWAEEARAGPSSRARPRAEDVFADLFGARKARRAAEAEEPGLSYELEIGFIEAARGTMRRLALPDGRKLDVRIPAGVREGQVIRLKGQGSRTGEAPARDVLITVRVAPHPLLRQEGRDIHLDLKVTVMEALFGARIAVPTIHGKVTLTIPEGSNGGLVLRLKGKGLPGTIESEPPGDQYVTLRIMLPPAEDRAFARLVRSWAEKASYSVRPEDEEG